MGESSDLLLFAKEPQQLEPRQQDQQQHEPHEQVDTQPQHQEHKHQLVQKQEQQQLQPQRQQQNPQKNDNSSHDHINDTQGDTNTNKQNANLEFVDSQTDGNNKNSPLPVVASNVNSQDHLEKHENLSAKICPATSEVPKNMPLVIDEKTLSDRKDVDTDSAVPLSVHLTLNHRLFKYPSVMNGKSNSNASRAPQKKKSKPSNEVYGATDQPSNPSNPSVATAQSAKDAEMKKLSPKVIASVAYEPVYRDSITYQVLQKLNKIELAYKIEDHPLHENCAQIQRSATATNLSNVALASRNLLNSQWGHQRNDTEAMRRSSMMIRNVYFRPNAFPQHDHQPRPKHQLAQAQQIEHPYHQQYSQQQEQRNWQTQQQKFRGLTPQQQETQQSLKRVLKQQERKQQEQKSQVSVRVTHGAYQGQTGNLVQVIDGRFSVIENEETKVTITVNNSYVESIPRPRNTVSLVPPPPSSQDLVTTAPPIGYHHDRTYMQERYSNLPPVVDDKNQNGLSGSLIQWQYDPSVLTDINATKTEPKFKSSVTMQQGVNVSPSKINCKKRSLSMELSSEHYTIGPNEKQFREAFFAEDRMGKSNTSAHSSSYVPSKSTKKVFVPIQTSQLQVANSVPAASSDTNKKRRTIKSNPISTSLTSASLPSPPTGSYATTKKMTIKQSKQRHHEPSSDNNVNCQNSKSMKLNSNNKSGSGKNIKRSMIEADVPKAQPMKKVAITKINCTKAYRPTTALHTANTIQEEPRNGHDVVSVKAAGTSVAHGSTEKKSVRSDTKSADPIVQSRHVTTTQPSPHLTKETVIAKDKKMKPSDPILQHGHFTTTETHTSRHVTNETVITMDKEVNGTNNDVLTNETENIEKMYKALSPSEGCDVSSGNSENRAEVVDAATATVKKNVFSPSPKTMNSP